MAIIAACLALLAPPLTHDSDLTAFIFLSSFLFFLGITSWLPEENREQEIKINLFVSLFNIVIRQSCVLHAGPPKTCLTRGSADKFQRCVSNCLLRLTTIFVFFIPRYTRAWPLGEGAGRCGLFTCVHCDGLDFRGDVLCFLSLVGGCGFEGMNLSPLYSNVFVMEAGIQTNGRVAHTRPHAT